MEINYLGVNKSCDIFIFKNCLGVFVVLLLLYDFVLFLFSILVFVLFRCLGSFFFFLVWRTLQHSNKEQVI